MIIDLSIPRLTWRKAADPQRGSVIQDCDLVRRVANGDSQAVAEVYDLYAPSMYRVLNAILGSAEDAEDALQEIFAKLASGRAGRVRDLRAYLFTTARNEACGILRRRRREQVVEIHPPDALETIGAEPSEQPLIVTADLTMLLQRLPAEQREVIALKVFEELTFAQIAVIVKASPNTVASRYRYGIERLRGWYQTESAGGE